MAGEDSYFIMLSVEQKEDKNKKEALFGEKGLMIGTLWIAQGKNRLEKKLFLKQGFKHLLFKAETVDKKVVKKDIVEVRVSAGPLRLSSSTSTASITKLARSEWALTKERFQQALNSSKYQKIGLI